VPILTFLGDLAAIFGGLIVTWIDGGVTPVAFLTELQYPIGLHRFWAGMIKAPVMALVIGIVASAEGFAVEGSAESLGAHVTASVVKSIFTVIVVDGFFSIFYVAVNF
jgi:phospholipid/cholesterol/gamma-HCH transport system permease protein